MPDKDKRSYMKISSIAVFCGSKTGNNKIFEEHAATLGKILAANGVSIIYGGGNKGLMGAVANAALGENGKVIGIIPKMLADFEHQHNGLTELTIVDTMHIRKQLLYEKCDAAIILPGGYGTLDEVFEMLTWNQLDIHSKKIFFLNTDGFYTHLLAHIEQMQDESFLYGHPTDLITVLEKPEELLAFLGKEKA